MSTRDLVKLLEKKLGPPTFGGFLRSIRTMNDLTQAEMAKKIGFSKSSICDIEKGRQFVSIELAAKIAKKFDVSEAYAIQCVISDSIRRAGLKFEITIKKQHIKKAA
ncbi:MAG: helix-turn-helix transcriptional regulator [Bdellovibrionota bacterium]